MATNPPKGDGHRNGMVRGRSQTYNPKTEQWVKRDTDTGRFMDVKQDGTPFKGVRKEMIRKSEAVFCPAIPAYNPFYERRLLHGQKRLFGSQCKSKACH